jgi:site-specific DNA-methyltransferase (adenine-specific)|tara:strand:- start:77 stop:739 length:663 start_codon:yes stop_codon:yes gene_type:complete
MIDLRLGDCLEVMKTIEDNSIDAIITDPPYKVISGGQTKTANAFYKGKWKNDGKIFKHNEVDFNENFMSEMFRIMKEQSHIYFFTNFLNLNKFLTLFEKSDFYIHNLLVWEKKPVVNRWYLKNAEYVIFAKKGKAKSINNKGSRTVHKFDVPKNKTHPTQKPVDLIEYYINNSTNEEDTVLDMFMGSGTTAIACKNTNRNFIGCELDEEFFNVAVARVDG